MPKNTAAQTTATLRLRRIAGESCGRSEVRGDIVAKPHQGDHENQDHEQEEPQGQGDVAAPPRLALGLGLTGGIAHRNSSSGARPATCSTSNVANSRVR